MVKEEAQLYTMEGIAAGLIMLLTTYLVLGSTSVYTPGDTHITDMQLEQVGSDILRVMDTPMNLTGSLQPNRTDLELMVNTSDGVDFNREFMNTYLCNPKAVAMQISVMCTDIQINTSIWYVGNSNFPESYLLPNGSAPGIGPGVRVSHWILTDWRPGSSYPGVIPPDMKTEPQDVLVEVLIWKT